MPLTQLVIQFVKHIRKTEMLVANFTRQRTRAVCLTENIIAVSESVSEQPQVRHLSQQFYILYTSSVQVLRKDLAMKPY